MDYSNNQIICLLLIWISSNQDIATSIKKYILQAYYKESAFSENETSEGQNYQVSFEVYVTRLVRLVINNRQHLVYY